MFGCLVACACCSGMTLIGVLYFLRYYAPGIVYRKTREEIINTLKEHFDSYCALPNLAMIDFPSSMVVSSLTQYDPLLSYYLFCVCWNVEISNCSQFHQNIPLFANFTDVYKLNNPNKNELIGFILSSPDMVLLVFTGTMNLEQVQSDVDFTPIVPNFVSNPEFKIHSGFYNLYNFVDSTIRDILKTILLPSKKFVIAGHSLGGALATVAHLALQTNNTYSPITYTFASPRVVNMAYANYISSSPTNQLYRVVNVEDEIPTLPPQFPLAYHQQVVGTNYTHVGHLIAFSKNMGSMGENHDQSYMEYLKASKNEFLSK